MGTIIGTIGVLILLVGKRLRDITALSYMKGEIDRKQYGDDMLIGLCTILFGCLGVVTGIIIVIYKYLITYTFV